MIIAVAPRTSAITVYSAVIATYGAADHQAIQGNTVATARYIAPSPVSSASAVASIVVDG